jgi:hypothetical protein
MEQATRVALKKQEKGRERERLYDRAECGVTTIRIDR